MLAITVSTNYDDLLNITLPQNARFFKKWYIVTRADDEKTLNVIKSYNYPNIEVLFFDFQANGKTFNFGGAIRYAQQQLKASPADTILNLDSDIYLPDHFLELIDGIDLQPNTIYGTGCRLDFFSYDHFKNNIVDSIYPYAQRFQGYFQLYKYNPSFLWEESNDCSACDLAFSQLFEHRIIISNLTVAHLGKSAIHWGGRKTRDDFLMS